MDALDLVIGCEQLARSLNIEVIDHSTPNHYGDFVEYGRFEWVAAEPVTSRSRRIHYWLDFDNLYNSFMTLVHELGHAILGHERIFNTDAAHGVVELEAESVARMVLNELDIPMSVITVAMPNHGFTTSSRVWQAARYIVRNIQ